MGLNPISWLKGLFSLPNLKPVSLQNMLLKGVGRFLSGLGQSLIEIGQSWEQAGQPITSEQLHGATQQAIDADNYQQANLSLQEGSGSQWGSIIEADLLNGARYKYVLKVRVTNILTGRSEERFVTVYLDEYLENSEVEVLLNNNYFKYKDEGYLHYDVLGRYETWHQVGWRY